MALLDKGIFGASPLVLVGVAGLVFGPRLLRLAGRAGRPVARTALRSGVDVYDRTREGLGRTRDGLGGLIEESRAELHGREEEREQRPKRRPPPRRPKRTARGPGGEPAPRP